MNFNLLPAMDRVEKTISALKDRGVSAHLVESKEAALKMIRTAIPSGASVMTAASVTLKQVGFEDVLKTGDHPWKNLKGEILAEKDPAKQSVLRKQATLADYYLGSVHAIAETGEVVIASMSGSQISSYAYSSKNIIWVAGTQKIVPSLDDAIRRVREYVLPLEDEHMKSLGNKNGSSIGKLLIFEREAPHLRRSVTLVLINEILGF
ncbi:MAG TPA: lactate utilization protein [Bacteroidota bacterium]|nr:lactate utilization protein [Bacteroidota bacterium]